MYRCKIYKTKPDVCNNFPSKAAEIKEYPSCSFQFTENGERIGECNGCGQCCLTCWITPPGYDRKYKDEKCPYLEEI